MLRRIELSPQLLHHTTVDQSELQLAIDGGPAVFPEGPPPWPLPDDAVRLALEEAYHNGSWGVYHGPNCRRLAQRLGDFHHLDHVLLTCSGTIAVEVALRAVGVAPGDRVLLAGYDFPGNFRSVESVGARPVLLDIRSDTWCIDAEQLAGAGRPRALLVSHLHGGMAPMRTIRTWADDQQLPVVEDVCQAPGALVDGRRAGTWGDVSVLSFGGSKLVSAGRGGAMVTASAEFMQRAKVFHQRGNEAFPLSELQAAVILPQWAALEDRNALRRHNVRRLIDACADLICLRPVACSDDWAPSYYKLAWMYDAALCGGATRETFIAAVQAEGVHLDAGFRGFALRSSRRCDRAGDLLQCRRAAEQTVLLHHPVLLKSDETIARVASALKKVVNALNGSHFKTRS